MQNKLQNRAENVIWTQSKESCPLTDFKLLQLQIDKNIIEEKSAAKLTSLQECCIKFLGDESTTYNILSVNQNIKTYPDTLYVYTLSKNRGTVIYHRSLTESEAFNFVDCDDNSVKSVARYLRELVL